MINAQTVAYNFILILFLVVTASFFYELEIVTNADVTMWKG